MATADDPRQLLIQPRARQHALGFCLFGLLLFALSMLLWLAELPLAPAAYALIWLVSAALLGLGIAKLREPPVTLQITPSRLSFYQPRGQWQLAWSNLQRFDVPRVSRGLSLEPLAYVGLRLHDIEPVLQQLSPRLAVQLLSEQRHLLILALRHERPELRDYSSYFELPEHYVASSGRCYRGVLALFAVRSQQLRELLGYDLYLPASALDRSPEDFCVLLKQLAASL